MSDFRVDGGELGLVADALDLTTRQVHEHLRWLEGLPLHHEVLSSALLAPVEYGRVLESVEVTRSITTGLAFLHAAMDELVRGFRATMHVVDDAEHELVRLAQEAAHDAAVVADAAWSATKTVVTAEVRAVEAEVRLAEEIAQDAWAVEKAVVTAEVKAVAAVLTEELALARDVVESIGPGHYEKPDATREPPGYDRQPYSVARSLMNVEGLEKSGRHNTVAVTLVAPGPPPTYRIELPGINPGDGFGPADTTLPDAMEAELTKSSPYVTAMRQLILDNIPKGANVMLVGHSEGGIVAMDLAADPSINGGHCHVAYVATAGSPIDTKHVAPGTDTQVLEIRNADDPVPYLEETTLTGSVPDATANVHQYYFTDPAQGGFSSHGTALYADHLADYTTTAPTSDVAQVQQGMQQYLGPSEDTQFYAVDHNPL